MKEDPQRSRSLVDETLAGLCAAHPQTYRLIWRRRAGHRACDAWDSRQGCIVSGGGSGHLPVFTGYVGTGLLDACAIGDVFASPSSDQMAEAIRAADQGVGCCAFTGTTAAM